VAETKVSAAEREPEAAPERDERRSRSVSEALRAVEVDTRLLGLLGGLVIIWIIFAVITPGHTFLTPRNLWNLSVQTAVVAIMATGMVLIIVTRNIDLSVGAVMAAVGMAMAIVQHDWLPQWIGFDHPLTWVIAVAVGLVLGAAIGAFQGTIIAYVGVPSFIVTLGGFLVWRGVAWWMASGQTIAPMDTLFRKLGGGSTGTLGGTWSWILGIAACVGVVLLQFT
jgi:D-xylose transport system permease protein